MPIRRLDSGVRGKHHASDRISKGRQISERPSLCWQVAWRDNGENQARALWGMRLLDVPLYRRYRNRKTSMSQSVAAGALGPENTQNQPGQGTF